MHGCITIPSVVTCLSGHCSKLSLLLPLLRWHTCPCCTGVTTSIALASLPSTRWHHYPSCAGFCLIAMPLATHCCCRAGVFAGAVLVSLPVLRWHLCQHCAGIVALVAQASPPASRWRLQLSSLSLLMSLLSSFSSERLYWAPPASLHLLDSSLYNLSNKAIDAGCRRRCTGINAFIAWALLPLLRWHCCPCCLCIAASITNWHLPSHKAVTTGAGIIASIVPLTLLE